MTERTTCELCGEPMPPGEEMFKCHGYSGPCPRPMKVAPSAPAPGPQAGEGQERLRELADGLDEAEEPLMSRDRRQLASHLREIADNMATADEILRLKDAANASPSIPEALRQEAIEAAAAQLLIALAFLVPKGTDLRKEVGPQLVAYKDAIDAAAYARGRANREATFKAGWASGYYDGGEHDCRMFPPTAERAWEDYLREDSR